jgi:hypothetical protein
MFSALLQLAISSTKRTDNRFGAVLDLRMSSSASLKVYRTIFGLESRHMKRLAGCCFQRPEVLDINHDAAAHSKIHQAPLQSEKNYQVPPVTLQAKRTRVAWTDKENREILEMKGKGCSWEEIDLAFQQRNLQRTSRGDQATVPATMSGEGMLTWRNRVFLLA